MMQPKSAQHRKVKHACSKIPFEQLGLGSFPGQVPHICKLLLPYDWYNVTRELKEM
jgi:hypothetical protein